jgi:hypothetical protein
VKTLSFFSDLRSKEHPLIIRLLVAFIVFAFALVWGIGLAAATSRASAGAADVILMLLVFLAVLMGLGLLLKRNGFPLATLLGIPLAVGLSVVNHRSYAGVISPWPLFIIALAWALAFILGRKRPKTLQIGFFALMAIAIVITTYLSLPKHTYAQAKAFLAGELELSRDQLGPGLGFMPSIQCFGAARPSIFVNRAYFFDAQAQGMVATYFFDPVSGEWFEAHPPRSLDSLTRKELDPTTRRWLEELQEKGIEFE